MFRTVEICSLLLLSRVARVSNNKITRNMNHVSLGKVTGNYRGMGAFLGRLTTALPTLCKSKKNYCLNLSFTARNYLLQKALNAGGATSSYLLHL